MGKPSKYDPLGTLSEPLPAGTANEEKATWLALFDLRCMLLRTSDRLAHATSFENAKEMREYYMKYAEKLFAEETS